MAFAPERLRQALGAFPPARRYVVALSGGLDSTVLLHALATGCTTVPVIAAHVDHGWDPRSPAWGRHCAALCALHGIPFHLLNPDCTPGAGESREAAARRGRYGALTTLLGPEEMLLTAHHQDDQAETLLLQLFRGAGVRGLAAMPQWRRLGPGWHGRPLLGFTRAELVAYAEKQALQWLEDPSNQDLSLDRNRLRRELLPAAQGRWPGLSRTLARTAAHMAEASTLLDEVAGADLHAARGPAGTLRASAVRSLSPARSRNLLRYWIRERGFPAPASSHLERIVADLLTARADAEPRVSWAGAELRRYRDELYLMPPQTPVPEGVFPWSLADPLEFEGIGTLRAIAVEGEGFRLGLGPVEVRFRTGGEACRLAGRGTHRLKQLYQESGVPPWVRAREPLIYAGGQLCAVADRFVCESFSAKPGEPGLRIEWQR